MKRKLCFLLFILFVIPFSFSQEQLLDASVRVLFPELNNPEVMGFINFGYGRYYPIVPHVISPGIHIDAGFGIDWLYVFSDEDDKDKNKELKHLGLNCGLRLFNLIELGVIDINMFAGFNVVLGQLDNRAPVGIINPAIGASLTIKFIGIEYSYYFPSRYSDNIAFHHISIIITIKDSADFFE